MNIKNEIVKLATKLINIPTTKENYGQFEICFNLIKEELKNYKIKEFKFNNYNNLIISNTEEKELDIIFCGHIDVVPSHEYKATIKDNILCGRGSFDMKSQLAVITQLLKYNTSNKKIAFIITSDEEIGGACCKEILKEYNAKLAIIPDGGKNFELVTEEKGLLQLEITTYGKKAHASEPFNGENAILKLMSIYNKLTKIYKNPRNISKYISSINLSKIKGGEAINSVPSEATMILDIRYVSPHSKQDFITAIKSIEPNCELKVLDEGPAFKTDYNDEEIKKFITNASEVLNKKIKITKCLATSDAIYFSEKGIPTVIINPVGDYWHSDKEYVDTESLSSLYEIFKKLL